MNHGTAAAIGEAIVRLAEAERTVDAIRREIAELLGIVPGEPPPKPSPPKQSPRVRSSRKAEAALNAAPPVRLRPKTSNNQKSAEDESAIAAALAVGKGIRETARELGVATDTVAVIRDAALARQEFGGAPPNLKTIGEGRDLGTKRDRSEWSARRVADLFSGLPESVCVFIWSLYFHGGRQRTRDLARRYMRPDAGSQDVANAASKANCTARDMGMKAKPVILEGGLGWLDASFMEACAGVLGPTARDARAGAAIDTETVYSAGGAG